MCTAIHERRLVEPADASMDVTSAPHAFVDDCRDPHC